MNNAEVLVSVIVPVYNVEKYLREALDSVRNQTLRELEIICVDDGSTDDSGNILDEYALKDSRFHIIHKENTGYGNSMNIGIDMAAGKYIGILEPDDFITRDMFKDLFETAEKENADFVKSDFAFLEGEKEDYQIRPVKIKSNPDIYNKILTAEEKKILFEGYLAHWTCLYRKAFLEENNICFNETPGASHQDTGFWFQTMVCANRIYLLDKYYYHYRQDNPNASMKNKKKIHCIIKEYDYILDKLKENEKYLVEYLPQYVMCRYAAHRDTIDRLADEYKREFIVLMAQGFNEMKENGTFDVSAMDETDKKNLLEIMKNPDEYYKKRMDVINAIHNAVCSYENIYIYGAGFMGRKVLKQLREEDRGKVRGFLVTKKENNIRILDGVPICEFNEQFRMLNEKDAIIIGVTRKYEEEIVRYMQEYGLINIIRLPDELV